MPLPMLGERRAVRLRSDLDVTVVHHAYLPRDRHAAVLVFPYGLRHEPGRAPGTLAALALHLGGPEGPAALGHETLTLAVDGPDLPQLLAALADLPPLAVLSTRLIGHASAPKRWVRFSVVSGGSWGVVAVPEIEPIWTPLLASKSTGSRTRSVVAEDAPPGGAVVMPMLRPLRT